MGLARAIDFGMRKRIVSAAEPTFRQACEDIAARNAIVDHDPDARGGVQAWREKGPPRFNQRLGEPA